MKKFKYILASGLIASSISSVALAEVNVYGSVRLAASSFDSQDELKLTDELSRIGVKGKVDLGDGSNKGFARLEFRVNAENGTLATEGAGNLANRLSFAGVKGDWGVFQVGRQWSFASLWVHFQGDAGFNDVDHNDTRNVMHRIPDAVTYISPNMNGFQYSAQAVMGGSGARLGFAYGPTASASVPDLLAGDAGPLTTGQFDNNDESFDAVSLVAKYKTGNFYIAGTTTSTTAPAAIAAAGGDDYSITSVVASYKFDKLKASLLVNAEENVGGTTDIDLTALGLTYSEGKNTFKLLHTTQDWGVADNSRISLGYQRTFSKQARMYVEASTFDNANRISTIGGVGLSGDDLTSVGFRFDF